MMSLHFITDAEGVRARGRAIAAPQHHSAALRVEPAAQSQAKPAAVIAGALDDLPGLIATACGFLIFFLVYGVFA